MGIDPKTLGVRKEGGYIPPDYAYVQRQEYSWEEICEHARQAFKSGDEATWDGVFWAVEAVKGFTSEKKAVKEFAKDVNKSVRWVQRGLQVYRRFAHLRDNFAQLYFEHFRVVVVIEDELEAEKWLERAADNNWSASRLYREMTSVGAYPKERYKPVGVYEGKLDEAEDGFRVYHEEGEYTILENELDKLKGKKVRVILSVKEEGTEKEPQKKQDAETEGDDGV